MEGKEKQRRKRIDEDEDKHATNGPWVSEDKEGGQEKVRYLVPLLQYKLRVKNFGIS